LNERSQEGNALVAVLASPRRQQRFGCAEATPPPIRGADWALPQGEGSSGGWPRRRGRTGAARAPPKAGQPSLLRRLAPRRSKNSEEVARGGRTSARSGAPASRNSIWVRSNRPVAAIRRPARGSVSADPGGPWVFRCWIARRQLPHPAPPLLAEVRDRAPAAGPRVRAQRAGSSVDPRPGAR